MATLDPLTSRNFQPINGNHRDISVRFLSTNVTGLRQIRRDGDCQLTRAVDEHPTTLRCSLLTDLHYEVVVNFRYNNMTIRNLSVNGTFYDVKGPLTVTFKRSLPVKLDFSPRFDAMVNSLARRFPRPKWYDLMEKEFYLTMIHLFEFATQKAFATEMFRAAKDVPFPE
uniref:FHA domain-containing protein n=1 Tax=Amblyomma maculatum TaxID=34609 RepID=G3MTN7_AMBMU